MACSFVFDLPHYLFCALAGLVGVGLAITADMLWALVHKSKQKDHLVLFLLFAMNESYGLELVHRSFGLLDRTTLYFRLKRMEDEGLISSRQSPVPLLPGQSARRLYTITAKGLVALERHLKEKGSEAPPLFGRPLDEPRTT